MANSDDSAQRNIPPQDLGTRQIRGLSQRLRRPLTPEANLPPDVSPPSSQPEPPESAPPPAEATVPPAPQPPPADSSLHTRPVSSQTKPVRDGLLSEGVILQSRYKILGVIGIGGMGAVYKAQDLRFANVTRVCAVKEMINTATDPQVRQMIVHNFEREASILATLSHPAIPQVYDFFTEGARSYLALEFINGKDLEAILSETEGFISEIQVIDWAIQLCDVLMYLHSHKPRPIIFRDLKPSNIMLDDHNRIRLVDFGIAKLFQSGERGTMIGTEGYSPPEQYRGMAEPRNDVYSLGATLHHLLSKQDPRLEPPFSFHERPIHKTNPTVSRELTEIVEKALMYDVNQRWGSADEMKRALLTLPGARGIAGGAPKETAAFSAGSVKPLWRFACEDEIRVAVAVSEGVVYVPSYDHNVYALEASSGKFMWKYATEGGIASTPWVMEDLVVFGSTDTVVYAVEARTGRLVWTAPTKGKIFSSPYGEFGHLFIGSDDSNLYAIHGPSGRIAWTYHADGQVRTRPVLQENLIFFACQMGMVYALGLNRELKWRFHARRGFLAAPTLGKGLVLIGSLDWNLYALDLRSGWTAWRYHTGGSIVSTAAVAENLVLFGSADNFIYALDTAEGRLVWRYQTEGQVTGSPAVYGENVYIGGVDGSLYCLEVRTGKLRWRYQMGGAITGAPVIEDGVLYIGSNDRYIYAIPA